MTAKRLAIVEAVVSRMQALSSVHEVQVMATGDPSRFPAIFIEDGGHQSDPVSEPGVTRYDLSLTVEGYVEGDGGTAAHDAFNALYIDVVAAIIGDDSLLDGLAEEIDEGDMRLAAAQLSGAMRAGFALDFSIRFAANRAGPVA